MAAKFFVAFFVPHTFEKAANVEGRCYVRADGTQDLHIRQHSFIELLGTDDIHEGHGENSLLFNVSEWTESNDQMAGQIRVAKLTTRKEAVKDIISVFPYFIGI